MFIAVKKLNWREGREHSHFSAEGERLPAICGSKSIWERGYQPFGTGTTVQYNNLAKVVSVR